MEQDCESKSQNSRLCVRGSLEVMDAVGERKGRGKEAKRFMKWQREKKDE